MKFTLRAQTFELSRDAVEDAVHGMVPDSLVKYAVKIHGKWYPPKQVLAAATGLPVVAFTTQDAYRIIHRLGFPVVLASSLADRQDAERPEGQDPPNP